MDQSDPARPSVPVSYLLLTLEQARDWGIPREPLLDGTGINESLLADPESHVSFGDYGQVVYRLSVAQRRERELALRGGREPLLARVRALLNAGDGYLDLEAVASRLGMSSRTLKRRLREHGFTFRRLLEEVRCRDGIRLLEDTQLSVEDISFQLGYTAPGNFTRAFRSWTGTTPAAFRRGPRPRLDAARAPR